MANQQEQKLARDLIKILNAQQPKRRIVNGKAIIEQNGVVIELPMYVGSTDRTTNVSSR